MAETSTKMSTENGSEVFRTSAPLSKKVLENIDKILKHMEVSREDLFSVTKSLVEAFKALNSRLHAAESDHNLLLKNLLDSVDTCNALQEDVLRLRQANTAEVANSDKLAAEVAQLKEQLRQLMPMQKKGQLSNHAEVSPNFLAISVETVEKKVDETGGGHVGDEIACAGKDKSGDEVPPESDIVKPVGDLQMQEEVDSVNTSSTTISSVEGKLTTEYGSSEEDGEDEEEEEKDEDEEKEVEEEENSFKECVGATNKPVITSSSLTTVSITTADAAVATATAAAQKPEIISHSVTHDDSATLTSYNADQPTEEALPLQPPPKQHHFEETSRLWFNSCHLCKSSIIPTAKFYVCTGCRIKVDKGCFEGGDGQRMAAAIEDVPCITVNLVRLVEAEREQNSHVGHHHLLLQLQQQPQVPTIIVECCKQIEEQSLAILKRAGTASPGSFGAKFSLKGSPQPLCLYVRELDGKSSKEVEKLFATFARTHSVGELKLATVHPTIISGLLVRLLQSLGQPLVDSKWWNECLRASNPCLTAVQRRDLFTRLLTTQLEPVVHRHTLAYLLLHLKRVLFKLPTVSKSGRLVVDKHQLLNLFGPLIAPSFNRAPVVTTPVSGILGSSGGGGSARSQGGKQALMKMTNLKRQIVVALFNLPQECLLKVLKSGAEPQTPGTAGKQSSPRTTNFGSILMNERQRQSFNKQMNSNIY